MDNKNSTTWSDVSMSGMLPQPGGNSPVEACVVPDVKTPGLLWSVPLVMGNEYVVQCVEKHSLCCRDQEGHDDDHPSD